MAFAPPSVASAVSRSSAARGASASVARGRRAPHRRRRGARCDARGDRWASMGEDGRARDRSTRHARRARRRAARAGASTSTKQSVFTFSSVRLARCFADARATNDRPNDRSFTRLSPRARPRRRRRDRARRRAGAFYHPARASTRGRVVDRLSRATTTRRRRIDGFGVGSHRQTSVPVARVSSSSADRRAASARARAPRDRPERVVDARENLTRRMFARGATAPRAVVANRRATTPRRSRKRITTIASASPTPEARAMEAQRWIDAWRVGRDEGEPDAESRGRRERVGAGTARRRAGDQERLARVVHQGGRKGGDGGRLSKVSGGDRGEKGRGAAQDEGSAGEQEGTVRVVVRESSMI